MDWMLMPYRRYFDFSGRSRRKEYWLFTLFFYLVCILFGSLILSGVVGLENKEPPGSAFWFGRTGLMLFVLGSIIPSIACAVRRFHDQNHSGWFYLLSFIPSVGWIVLIVFMCIEGTRGENQYGPDPQGHGDADVFV